MTPELEKLWQEVLAHWKDLADNGTEANSPPEADECAFCDNFCTREDEFSCQGCPIFIETQQRVCCGTPYSDVLRAYYRAINDIDKQDNCKLACARMYDWLLALYNKNKNETTTCPSPPQS